MMRRLTSLLLLLLFAGLPLLFATELTEGMSQDEVEGVLGKPSSVLHRGTRTLLLYPHKGRVEFEEGRAVLFSNVHAPAATTGQASQEPAKNAPKTSAQAPGAKTTQSGTAARPESTPKAPSTMPAILQPKSEGEIAEKQAAISDTLAKLSENPGGLGHNQAEPAVGFWTALLVECIVRTLVTVIVLKLAFSWADVHADWGQMWLPAFADSLTRAGIAAAALHFWHTTELLHIDDGVSYLVLLFTLMKTTHACTLPRAAAVTMAAKLASLIVWVLLSVALLNLLS